MAFSAVNPNSTSSLRAHTFGDGLKQVIMDWTALSGDTSGTVTIAAFNKLKHVLVLGGRLRHTAAPTYATNVATLAFTVPAETAASLVVQDITYTAAANLGAGGNGVTITYSDTVEAGSEVASAVGKAITVTIDSGESTATQVKNALDAAGLSALVTYSITGTASNAQTAASSTPLAGGVTGGGWGTLIALGY